MKPPPFDYAAPETIEEALALLNGGAEEARSLAGGQSLVPLLNIRFARPALLVDLGRVAGLDGIEHRNGHVRIGAMTRQRALETDQGIRDRFPLLADATELIAHVAIRTRGTVGGSLAHADPAAELPAAAMVLAARLVVRAADGTRRTVTASEFFVGPYTTAVEPGELLEAVEIDAPPAGTGWAFLELTRVHGAFALVGVAALVGLDASGCISRARLALCGVGGTPHAPEWLEEDVVGERPGEELFKAVGTRMSDSVEPGGDAHAGPEYRRRLAGVLARRALLLAAERATAREFG
jgi:aerobic carbon-monoxide dehydrogenase medium subunit